LVSKTLGCDNNPAAIEQAMRDLKTKLKDPQLIILATSGSSDPATKEGYDVTKIAKRANQLRGNALLLGTVSYKAVFTNAGYHRGNRGGLAVLGIKGSDLKVGLGIALISEEDSKFIKFSKIEQALLDAVKMAGKTTADKPSFIYISNVESLLLSFNELYCCQAG